MKQLTLKILVCVLLTAGCIRFVSEPQPFERFQSRKPVLHGELGSRFMVVPKGTMIGDVPAPDHGVFMTGEMFKRLVEDAIKNKPEHTI